MRTLRFLVLSMLSLTISSAQAIPKAKDIFITLHPDALPVRKLIKKLHEYTYRHELPEPILFLEHVLLDGYQSIYKTALEEALDEMGPILDTLERNNIHDEELEALFDYCCQGVDNSYFEVEPSDEEILALEAYESTTKDVTTETTTEDAQVTIQNMMVQPCICCPSSGGSSSENVTDLHVTNEIKITGSSDGGEHLFCKQEDGSNEAAVITFNLQKNGDTISARKINPYLGAARIRMQGNTSGKIFFDVTDNTQAGTILTERVIIEPEGLFVNGKIYATDGITSEDGSNVPLVPSKEIANQTKILYGLIDNWTSADRFGKPIITPSSGGFKPTEEQNQETGEGYETRATIHFSQSYTERPTVLPLMRSPDLQAVVDTLTLDYFTYSIRNVHTGQFQNMVRWQYPVSFLVIGF